MHNVDDLPGFVTKLMDQYESEERLVWHKGLKYLLFVDNYVLRLIKKETNRYAKTSIWAERRKMPLKKRKRPDLEEGDAG